MESINNPQKNAIVGKWNPSIIPTINSLEKSSEYLALADPLAVVNRNSG
jgi:hypothetical protein